MIGERGNQGRGWKREGGILFAQGFRSCPCSSSDAQWPSSRALCTFGCLSRPSHSCAPSPPHVISFGSQHSLWSARGSRTPCLPRPLARRSPRTLRSSRSSPPSPGARPERPRCRRGLPSPISPCALGSPRPLHSSQSPSPLPALGWPAGAVSAGCPPPFGPVYLALIWLVCCFQFSSCVPPQSR